MLASEDSRLHPLMTTHRKPGEVVWIGVRPGPRQAMLPVSKVEARQNVGLAGDHHTNRGGRRQVTLIQREHLDAVASILGLDAVAPELARRNIVVEGINLAALKDRRFRIGSAILEYSGLCHPCSRMEENLGSGGYNAMRTHGGILARVIQSGLIRVGDDVSPISIREQYGLAEGQ